MASVKTNPPQNHRVSLRVVLAIALGLAALTIAPFWPICSFNFVNLDDGLYVYANQRVQEGLSWSSTRWAFTTLDASFWFPITWLSYMLDYELYGLDARGYHLTNLILHVANTLLLFRALLALLKAGRPPEADSLSTQDVWKSAFVAALFAIHPLHVEPVAWVSGRKDLLCALFFFLMLIAYARYVSKGGFRRYGLVAVCMALGLMAKSMLVTAPFVLLLLDFWPLRRLRAEPGNGKRRSVRQMRFLVAEKGPLLAITALFSLLSIVGQRQEGALSSLEGLPLGTRVANAVYSYGVYLVKTVWPAGLTAFYPHPRDSLPFWQVGVAGVLLLAVCLGVITARRKRPYLAVGWLWFVGMIVPVCGLVQVGTHGMADRYTYIPLIGLFILGAWGMPEVLGAWRHRSSCLAAVGALVVTALLVVAVFQVRHWRNTETLFRHALHVTDDNALAYRTLGRELAAQGRHQEAEPLFLRLIELDAADIEARIDWASTLLSAGSLEKAAQAYAGATRLAPDDCRCHNGLGVVLLHQGQAEPARASLAEAVRLCPDFAEARTNLGAALLALGRWGEAATHLRKALDTAPNDPDIHTNLAAALIELGESKEARAHLEEALRINPGHVQARRNWGRLTSRSEADS